MPWMPLIATVYIKLPCQSHNYIGAQSAALCDSAAAVKGPARLTQMKD